jgi:hypothetical protein
MGRTFRIYYSFELNGKYFEAETTYSQCCKDILRSEVFPIYYDSNDTELEFPMCYTIQNLKEILEKEMEKAKVDYFSLLTEDYYDNEINAFAKCVASIVEHMKSGEEGREYVWIKVTSG